MRAENGDKYGYEKKLLSLSIVAIIMFCTLNIAIASTSNNSLAIDKNVRHTGDHNWMTKKSISISEGGFVLKCSSPAVANGIVYVGSIDHNIYALDANTGTKIWNYTTGSLVFSSPAVANGIVYVGS